SLDDLKSTYESVEELYRNGLRCISDMYTIKANTAEAEMELILQRSAVSIALGNLNSYLGLPFDCQLLIAPLEEPPVDQVSCRDITALVCEAENKRADLQAKYALLNEKEAILKREKANYLPKLSVDGNAGVQHYLRAQDKPKGLDYNIALSFNAPLYTGGEAAARKRMAWADIQTVNYDIDQQRLAIVKEISIYHRQFEASQELFVLVKSYMENAEQTFDGALERYKAGTISIFDLTVAQRLLAQARIRRAEAKSSWYRDLAGLSYSMGVIAKKVCNNN
nr:TolC family protein [Parachlamydiaceae bacterium]